MLTRKELSIPPCCLCVINLCDLKGISSPVPADQREKLWQEFFLDPFPSRVHQLEKVREHQTCQSSHVNGAITLVGVNFVAFSLLLSCLDLNLADI